MNVEFTDNSAQVKGKINDICKQWLDEAGGELASQAARNQTRRDTGNTAGAWTYRVTGDTATIGNPLENAIWEEYGTGEYALQGNGRKGGWAYEDAKGKWHFTKGKTPLRPLHKAFSSNRDKLRKRLEQQLKGLG